MKIVVGDALFFFQICAYLKGPMCSGGQKRVTVTIGLSRPSIWEGKSPS